MSSLPTYLDIPRPLRCILPDRASLSSQLSMSDSELYRTQGCVTWTTIYPRYPEDAENIRNHLVFHLKVENGGFKLEHQTLAGCLQMIVTNLCPVSLDES